MRGFSHGSSTSPEKGVALAHDAAQRRFSLNVCTTASQPEGLVMNAVGREPGGAQRLVQVLCVPVRAARVHVVGVQVGPLGA